MQKWLYSNAKYCLGILAIIFFFGCSVKQRHDTLTFFLDGVDKGAFFNDYLSKDSLSKDAIAKREGLLAKVRPELVVHQPFKEKKCGECHTPDKHLRMPLPGLCFQCHKNFLDGYNYVHGPVASGNCLNCHNQHSARYPKLLVRQGQQICLFCHNQEVIFKSKVHRDIEDAECTMCHSPHGGKSRFMVSDAVAGNIRSVLMNIIASRRLYGQLFSVVPGDFTGGRNEIAIVSDDGEIVSTTYCDQAGRFPLVNLHPDGNYTFRFKEQKVEIKIALTDNEGDSVYVIDKSRKGRYVFEKGAYEAVHERMKLTHPLPSLRKTGPHAAAESTAGQAAPDRTADKDVNSAGAGSKAVPEMATSIPAATQTKQADADVKNTQESPVSAPAGNTGRGKIVVKTLSDQHYTKTGHTVVPKAKTNGTPGLRSLAAQIGPFYAGNFVCVLNDSGDLLGIGEINTKGNFLLNGYLPYYHINVPEKSKDVIANGLFLNEKMELTGVVNKRMKNGMVVYEESLQKDSIVAMEMKSDDSTAPYSSVYFEYRKSELTPATRAELGRISGYLVLNPQSGINLAVYAAGGGVHEVRISEDRMKAVVKYLIAQGVKKEKISAKGFKTESVEKEEDAEKQRKNRRIDIFIR